MPTRFLFSKLRQDKLTHSATVLNEEKTKLNDVTSSKGHIAKKKTDLDKLPKVKKGFLYTGLLLLLAGSVILIVDPVECLVQWMAEFREGSVIVEFWKKPPIAASIGFYIFNYTNTEAFMSGQDKLKIEELGPYMFSIDAKNENVSFFNNNTFTSVLNTNITEDASRTIGDLRNDVIVVPNLALLGLTSYLADSSFFVNLGLNMFANLHGSQPFLTMSVYELLYGYDEPLMSYASKFMPKAIRHNKIGFLIMLADESDHVALINSNKAVEVKSDGQVIEPLTIHTFEGSAGLPHYGFVDADKSTHKPCNTLQGIASDGPRLPRKTNATDILSIYRRSFCRPFIFSFANYSFTDMGIPAMMFNASVAMYNNTLPENSCFCDPSRKSCFPNGLMDIGPCFHNMPVATSAPHFLHGDPKLVEAWENLSPDVEKHESYVIIEPSLGIMVKAHVRMQSNLVMKNVKYNKKVEPLKNMVLPIVWADVFMNDVPLYYHMLLYTLVVLAPIANKVVIVTMFVVGISCLAAFCLESFNIQRNLRRTLISNL